jgi:RNA polymerase sigma-70 factor (ECF subfamily)
MDIEEAFREYRESMVRAMVSFSGDEEAAEDGVSHAFTQALARRLMLEAMPGPAMKAWLYAAARNAIVDIKRREVRLSRFAGVGGDLELPDPREDDYAGRLVVEALLGKLPKSLRIPLELKYYGAMNATEIGEAMNLPAATVRTRLRAAMLRLREHF